MKTKLTILLILTLHLPQIASASDLRLLCTFTGIREGWFSEHMRYTIDTGAKTAVLEDRVILFAQKAPIQVPYKSGKPNEYTFRWKLKLPVTITRTVGPRVGQPQKVYKNIKYTASVNTDSMIAKVKTNVPNAPRPTGKCERVK